MRDEQCPRRGIFGDTCTLEQVQAELLGYSDFSLHCLALNNAPRFSEFLLDPEHLMDSAKCRALAELLPKLKVFSLLSWQLYQRLATNRHDLHRQCKMQRLTCICGSHALTCSSSLCGPETVAG